MAKRTTLTALLLILFLCGGAHAELIWWGGEADPSDAPPGKLLTDNPGYWGECVLTGVDYRYEAQPDKQADIFRDDAAKFGRRLIDGKPNAGVKRAAGPLVVVFDFKRNCMFTELDVITSSGKVGIKIECGDSGTDGWRTASEIKAEACPAGSMHRIKLPADTKGRYIRLSVDSGAATSLDEVLVWGDGEVTPENPEAINPIVNSIPIKKYCSFSVPGVDKTAMVSGEYRVWLRRLGGYGKLPASWTQVSTYDSITHLPIVPLVGKVINMPVQIEMARNETECAAVALINNSMTDTCPFEVSLSEFRKVGGGGASNVKGKLRVAGAMGSCVFGVGLVPLFEEGNLLGRSLMKRYLTNGEMIQDWPKLNITPMSSAIIWISVTTDGAEPGAYEAKLDCKNAPGIKVRVEVLDVTLPKPFAWLGTYSNTTSMFPFQYSDRTEREARYKGSLGVTVWYGFPDPGSPQALARQMGYRTISNVYGLPGKQMEKQKVDEINDDDKKAITNQINGLVKRAKDLGLTYDEWQVEFWDEPGKDGLPAYGKYAEIVHEIDPKIHIYCNPTYNGLGDWYNKLVDVSVPHYKGGLEDPPALKFYSAKRWVNAYYRVASNSSKGERSPQVELYRELAWNSIAKGWNGWAYYAYYAPEGNPWIDVDSEADPNAGGPDFVMVYPGPRGPVASRSSEALREGWEDYCLITLLRERGMKAEVDSLIKAFESGEKFETLRLRALQAAAKSNRGRK